MVILLWGRGLQARGPESEVRTVVSMKGRQLLGTTDPGREEPALRSCVPALALPAPFRNFC